MSRKAKNGFPGLCGYPRSSGGHRINQLRDVVRRKRHPRRRSADTRSRLGRAQGLFAPLCRSAQHGRARSLHRYDEQGQAGGQDLHRLAAQPAGEYRRGSLFSPRSQRRSRRCSDRVERAHCDEECEALRHQACRTIDREGCQKRIQGLGFRFAKPSRPVSTIARTTFRPRGPQIRCPSSWPPIAGSSGEAAAPSGHRGAQGRCRSCVRPNRR